jgi:uroporphyrinogen decarboxylase
VRPDANEADAAALASAGLRVLVDPYLVVRPLGDVSIGTGLLAILDSAGPGLWLVVTSPRTIPLWGEMVGRARLDEALAEATRKGMKTAVVGAATARTLSASAPAAVVSRTSSALGLLAALGHHGPAHAVLPGSAISGSALRDGLVARGWTVLSVPVYETAAVPAPPASAALIEAGEIAAVVLRSPSAVRAVATYADLPPNVLAVTVGPSTSAACLALPWTILEVAAAAPTVVARAVAARLLPAEAVGGDS